MSEHDQQVAVVAWCDLHDIPIFAIPNAARRSHQLAAYMKAEGLRAGVPDLFIPMPSGEYAGLFIEMKDVNGRPPRRSQMEWLERLNANGYAAYWAKGADQAIQLIQQYVSL